MVSTETRRAQMNPGAKMVPPVGRTGGKTETEDTDSDALIDGYTSDSEPLIDGYTSDSAALTDGDTSDSAALSGGGDEKSAVLLGSEDPLLAGEAVPGYYSAESPWLFLIP